MEMVTPLEADTRILIDRSLENLGWNLTGTEQNVFFEQPKFEEEKRNLGGKQPDYVLYSSDNQPLIVIEAKRKGERIDKALEQGIFYAECLKAPLVFATDGVFCKSFHTFEHKTPLLNGNELDELIRQTLAMKFLSSAEINTVSPKVQYDRKELIQIFDYANNLLRGVGLSAGLERFSEFSNILFLKLLSEKGVVNDAYSWDTIKKIPLKSRIDYINSTVFKALNEYYNDTMEIFTPLSMKDNDILDEIIKSLDPLTLTDVDSDIKGDAFEYFLKASTSSGNDLGEYFTPRHIVKTMVRLVNPRFGEKVYDPFCGTGGFLIESFRHIWNNMPRNPHNEEILREHTIYGTELTNTARIAKMNMILAGDGHSGIKRDDSLKNPVDGEYDVVLANMPYSQRTKFGGKYDVLSNNGDSICVQHCMKAINSASENGRMALVVPEGFLFRKDLKKTREYMLEHCELKSIISLPQGVFLPYTGVKTNIIYAEKVNQKIPSSQKCKHYWYFEVKSDGYSLDNYRRKLDTPSDLQKFEEYRKLDDAEQENMLEIGFDVVSFEKVKEKDYNFVGSRYKQINNYNGKYNLVRLDDICTLETGSRQKGGSLISGIPSIGGEQISTDGHIITSKMRYISQDFYEQMKRGILRNLDVLLVKDGATTGKTGLYRGEFKECAVNEHVFILRANSNINPIYLYHILKSNYFQKQLEIYIRGMIGGIGREILNIEIPLPPIEIQENIVKELENYQNIIDGAKKTLNNYFPVIYINPNWQFEKMKKICQIIAGQSPKSEFYNNNNKGLPFYQGNKLFGSIYLKEPEIWTTKNTKIALPNDVLLSVRAPVGDVNVCNNEICIGRGLIAIRVTKTINNKFLFFILKLYSNKLKSLSSGSTFEGITKQDVEDLNIPIPPLEEQAQIVAQLEAEQELINANKKIIEIFTKKIQDRINQLFEEQP